MSQEDVELRIIKIDGVEVSLGLRKDSVVCTEKKFNLEVMGYEVKEGEMVIMRMIDKEPLFPAKARQ